MGTYAEIIGLPGSGKSVFYREALRRLDKAGVRVFAWKNGPLERRLLSLYLNKYEPLRWGRNPRKLWASLKDRFDLAFSGSVRHESILLRSFLYSHTELVALILSILVRRGFPPWEKELVLGRYFDSFAHFQIARAVMGKGEAILTDPGLIQRGIALLGYRSPEQEEGDLRSYLRLTPLPDVLISVRVPPEVCLSRMQQRSFPRRLRGLNERDVMASLEICWTYQSMAEEEMQKRGAALIQVENEGPLPSSLEQLNAGLQRVGLGA
ncbi:MAG: hypothetical protein A4E72_02198 [Syntrophus sp. PtaU1.Bin208]|nr:MAG: hypothetical protein A4E72_02198 [Syntrophus sp. PtaU1.Bin208]